MQLLRNPIRAYAWGSRSVIAGIQGRPVPSPGPEAELWIGAHPGDPSRVEASGESLAELIGAAPQRVLGAAVAAEFGPRLPYLLKLLAAEAPLSLQAHPDRTQAAAGFAAEEAAGVPRDAPYRRYVDQYHKPELLVAVSPFRALCGFQQPGRSARLLAGLGVPALEPVVLLLGDGKLGEAVRALLSWPEADRPALVAAAVAGAEAVNDAEYRLVAELAAAYPADVGVLLALLLHQVTLAPGEAIFMPAGNLHAYLHGVGVEIMASSDNVLRGGLTPKYVDVAELLRVLRFEALAPPVLPATPVAPGVVAWPVPVPEFRLHRVTLSADVSHAELALPGPRTALCLSGEVYLDDRAEPVKLRSGQAAFGSPAGPLRLSGVGEVYVASVPTGPLSMGAG